MEPLAAQVPRRGTENKLYTLVPHPVPGTSCWVTVKEKLRYTRLVGDDQMLL